MCKYLPRKYQINFYIFNCLFTSFSSLSWPMMLVYTQNCLTIDRRKRWRSLANIWFHILLEKRKLFTSWHLTKKKQWMDTMGHLGWHSNLVSNYPISSSRENTGSYKTWFSFKIVILHDLSFRFSRRI